MSKELLSHVNTQVANWTVLYTKLHNYHWFVKGPNFFSLHEKFEELYNEAGVHIDELAERLLALGGKPVATLKGALEMATVKEASGGEKASDMVRQLSEDFTNLAEELKEGIGYAEDANDDATGDMLIGIKNSLEKHAWMLSAYLE